MSLEDLRNELSAIDRRIALFVLSRRWVGESPARIMVAFGAGMSWGATLVRV